MSPGGWWTLQLQSLEIEMKKLQSITKETTENFDGTLRELFEKKMRCEMAIYQVNHHNHTQVVHV